jgi:pimeloyl-ACP methyl ester carboxylesterase
VNTGNVEIAGMFAPKPLAMSAANDWTKELVTKGYPELKELYKLYGAEDKVSARAWLEYGHQYNQHAREFMYSWFVKHLKGKDESPKEAPYKPTPPKELSVFDAAHPRPKDELNAEKLREAMAKASDEQMAKLAPKDAASLKEFRRVVGNALRAMVQGDVPERVFLHDEGEREVKLDGLTLRLSAKCQRPDEVVPTVEVRGPRYAEDKYLVWTHPKGKSSLFEDGKAVPAVRALTDAGFAVLAIDMLGMGEATPPKPFVVDKGFAGYTFGYNRTLLANRVCDLLTAIAHGRWAISEKPIRLVGWGEMGPVAILAKAIAGDKVAKVAADMNQFRFENVKDTADPLMLPGAVKYGGMAAFLALCAPGEVLAHNHAGTASGKLSKAAYDAAGAADKLTRVNEKMDDLKVVEWLLK